MSEDSTPPDLLALFDEERAAAVPIRKGTRERVYAAVLRRTGPGGDSGGSGDGPGGGGGTPTGSPPPVWAALLVSSVLSGVVGFGLGALSQTDFSARDQTPTPSAVTATGSPEPVAEPIAHLPDPELPASARPMDLGTDIPDSSGRVEVAAVRGVVREPGTREVGSAQPPPAPEPQLDAIASEVETTPSDGQGSDTAAERALVDRARVALLGHRPHDSLLALMRHERRFPTGVLTEERDRLIIECLIEERRYAPARRRIARYRREHGQGLHREDVDRLEGAIPAP